MLVINLDVISTENIAWRFGSLDESVCKRIAEHYCLAALKELKQVQDTIVNGKFLDISDFCTEGKITREEKELLRGYLYRVIPEDMVDTRLYYIMNMLTMDLNIEAIENHLREWCALHHLMLHTTKEEMIFDTDSTAVD